MKNAYMNIDGDKIEKNRVIEIIKLMIIELNDFSYTQTGICKSFYTLLNNKTISPIEIGIMKKFLNLNKPTKRNKYKDVTQNPYWTNFVDTHSYWWKEIYDAPETRQIRIHYLTKLIENIK